MSLPPSYILASIRHLLPSLGLQVRTRRGDWCECLLLAEEESWVGHGENDDEALWRAMRAAFPTGPARALLLRAAELHAASSDAAAAAQVRAAVVRAEPAAQILRAADVHPSDTGEATAARTGGATAELVRGADAHHASEAAAAPPRIGGDGTGAAAERSGDFPAIAKGALEAAGAAALETTSPGSSEARGAAPDTERRSVEATAADLRDAAPVAAPAPATAAAVPMADAIAAPNGGGPVAGPVLAAAPGGRAAAKAHRDDDRGEPEVALKALIARIERDAPDLACAAPARQRLVLLGWLAAARAWQDAEPRNLRVSALVPDIVRRLRTLTDAWWPGTISAFQREAWPADCYRDLPDVDPNDLRSWDAVERIAGETLLRIEEDDAAAGLDADGWADAAFLHPAPEDPEELFEALVREIEQHGSLSLRQPKHLPVPDATQLLRWARMARWLRGAVEDKARWGAVMGRLRFWCQGAAAVEARRTLDPTHRPPSPWSASARAASSTSAAPGRARNCTKEPHPC